MENADAVSSAGGVKCCVVVPCFNEEFRLNPEAFLSFIATHDGVRFVFVNDGSRDGTLSILRKLAEAMNGRGVVLDLSRNSGKAEAVRLGLLHAIQKEHCAVTGFWDADLATPLDAIPELLAVLDQRPSLEMVFGARVKLLGRSIERKRTRHYLGRVFATCVSVILDVPIYDTQCGAKLFRVTPQLISVLEQPFQSRWIFDVEILARHKQMNRTGGRLLTECLYEYPLKEWRDIAGSKVRPTDFLRAIAELGGIYRRYLSN